VVFNESMGENRDGASTEIDVPEVLRFAQDDKGYLSTPVSTTEVDA
jgi:hypothetical protein